MCPVWTPLRPPPSQDEVRLASDDVTIILQALRHAHKQKQDALLKSRTKPDPKTYYKTLYQESFKQEKPCLYSDSQISPCDKMASSETDKHALNLHGDTQGQGVDKDSLGASSDSHKLVGPHWFLAQASQDSRSRGSRNDFSMSFSKGFLTRTCADDGASSSDGNKQGKLTSFSPGLPHSSLEGIDKRLSVLDSPPIDTGFYQRFSQATCDAEGKVPKPTCHKVSTETGIHLKETWENVRESFRKEAGAGTSLNSKKLASTTGGIDNRHKAGMDRVSNDSQAHVGTVVGGSPQKVLSARDPACVGLRLSRPLEQHSLEAGRPPTLGAGREQITNSQVLSRTSQRPQSTSTLTEERQITLKRRVERPSGSKLLAPQPTGDALLTAKKKSTPSSNPQLCPRQTPAIDELFHDSKRVAPKDKGKLVKNVADMTHATRAGVGERLAGVEEIAMCITYKDGSSQLREPDTASCKKRCIGSTDGSAECLVLAYGRDEKTKGGRPESGIREEPQYGALDFISIPLNRTQEKTIRDWSRETLLSLLGKESIKKICFDAQEMMHALICSFGLDHTTVSAKWLVMDPKVAAWLLDADHPPITFSDLLGKHLPDQSETRMGSAICRDLLLLGTVMKRLFCSLNEAGLWQLFYDMEMKLCPILTAMEVQGIRVNSHTLEGYAKLLQRKSQQVEQEAYQAAGHPFQITSHSQLRNVLFEELQIDKKYHGKKLARTNVLNLKSTSETVLLKLQSLHPLPKLVLKYRQLQKLKSTYIDGILDCIQDGYVHTSWEQTSASSGRLQSANPNIQNIPKQPVNLDEAAEEGDGQTGPSSLTILARKPFVSHDNWSFIAADFQSIELRLLAHLSHDPVLLRVFNKRDCTDIFVELTSQWLGTPATDVTTAEREKTKRIVYSVIYGVGPDKLAETLGVSREEAKTFTKSFLNTFRGVSSFTRTAISCCQRHGFVQTIFKRRRLIPSINSSDFHVRSHAERQCVNFVVQGSAADICKIAMIHVVHALSKKPELKARLVVQIHDELLLEVADHDVDSVKGILKSAMEVTEFHCGVNIQLQVPLPVSIAVGKNWGQLE